jgi:hypothetical protein
MPHREYYAVFLSPGTLFSEQTSKRVDSWDDCAQACELAKTITERYDATPYGFYFETRIVADPIDDGEGGQLCVEPKIMGNSGVHFLGGQLVTYDEVVERDDPKESIMRSNMADQDQCICCINTNSFRSTMPFKEDAVLLDPGDDEVHVAYRAARKKARDEEFAAWEAKAKAEKAAEEA